ncbi:MAG TPA: YceI family protein [Acidimicrobiia bacterium]|nr:YceI family protein [Acidimicrobiia bacterium]
MTEPRRRLSRKWMATLVAVVVGAAAGAYGIYWFLSSDPPPPVDIGAIASTTTVVTAPRAPTDEDPSDDSEALGSPDGEWTVDTTVGEFAITEQTRATFVGFRVDEVLRSIGSTTAVGRTPGVTGSLEIVGTTLVSVEVVGDLTLLVSNESRRDGAVQRSLDTNTHPTAVFTLTEPVDFGDESMLGEAVSVDAVGTLTLKGTTQPVEVAIEAQAVGDRILVVGSFEIQFEDYDVTPPSAVSVLSVEDHGIIEFQVWFSRVGG